MLPAVKICIIGLASAAAIGVIAKRDQIFYSLGKKPQNQEQIEQPQPTGEQNTERSAGGKQQSVQNQEQPAQPIKNPPQQPPQNPVDNGEQGRDSNPTQRENGQVVQQTPSTTIDYQCKFGDDTYENSPNKKALKEFLKAKGDYGLQILEEGDGAFKCAKDHDDGDLADLKGFLESNSDASQTFNTPNNKRGTPPLPIAVKKKTGSTPPWTIMGPSEDDGNQEEILAPIQPPNQ